MEDSEKKIVYFGLEDLNSRLKQVSLMLSGLMYLYDEGSLGTHNIDTVQEAVEDVQEYIKDAQSAYRVEIKGVVKHE